MFLKKKKKKKTITGGRLIDFPKLIINDTLKKKNVTPI